MSGYLKQGQYDKSSPQKYPVREMQEKNVALKIFGEKKKTLKSTHHSKKTALALPSKTNFVKKKTQITVQKMLAY